MLFGYTYRFIVALSFKLFYEAIQNYCLCVREIFLIVFLVYYIPLDFGIVCATSNKLQSQLL